MPASPINVAIVDDDPLFLDHVSAILANQGGMRVTKVGTGDQLIRELDQRPIECIVLDYDLGQENGLGVADRIRIRYPTPPPIVLLTGGGGERTAIKAFRLGLSDYVTKQNLDTSELVGAIRGAIERHQHTLNLRADLEFHKNHSAFDGTTGLYSATYISEYLAKLIWAPEGQSEFSVVGIRMDGVDGLGRTFGPLIADQAIRSFGRRVQSATRSGEVCGRLDKGTFVCVTGPAADDRTAAAIRDRFVRHLAFDAEFDTVTVQLSATVGLAHCPRDGNDIDSLLQRALAASDAEAAAPSSAPAPAETAEAVPAGVANRRRDQRRRVLKRGKIYVEGLHTVVDCTIRNLSDSGARLRVNSYFVAPETFFLTVVGSTGRLPVVTRWQAGNDFGVEFVQRPNGGESRDQ